ncbi:MAG: SEC-C domain-containing protein [Alphaproteobacteria bacterium]|nr:SEC-C domain-containing protein [Alphaproteobacteria bacterium]
MISVSPTRRCPCGSGRRYKRCCMPWHSGRPAPTPEALMRSRYSAYALGQVEHVMATTHPESPHRVADPQRWTSELSAFCRGTRFRKLDVIDHSEDGDAGTVTFRATLEQAGRDASFTERSRFRRLGGRWLYLDGDRLDG